MKSASSSDTTKKIDGLFAIHKPTGMTSHDVIDELRKITGIKKIGHAGTLDPEASGVLVVGVGKSATKKLGEQLQKDKEYIATICLGKESSTDDSEGNIVTRDVKIIPQDKGIQNVLHEFIGDIEQTPSRYSAIKIDGIPAYKRARRGESFEMPKRTVHIFKIELLSYEWPRLNIRATTGSGTYIRTLARDIGEHLKTGGYLESLERTRVGEFNINNALTLDEFNRFCLTQNEQQETPKIKQQEHRKH